MTVPGCEAAAQPAQSACKQKILAAVHNLQAHQHSWHMWSLEVAAGVVAEGVVAAGVAEHTQGSSLGHSRHRQPVSGPLARGCRTQASALALASVQAPVQAQAWAQVRRRTPHSHCRSAASMPPGRW